MITRCQSCHKLFEIGGFERPPLAQQACVECGGKVERVALSHEEQHRLKNRGRIQRVNYLRGGKLDISTAKHGDNLPTVRVVQGNTQRERFHRCAYPGCKSQTAAGRYCIFHDLNYQQPRQEAIAAAEAPKPEETPAMSKPQPSIMVAAYARPNLTERPDDWVDRCRLLAETGREHGYNMNAVAHAAGFSSASFRHWCAGHELTKHLLKVQVEKLEAAEKSMSKAWLAQKTRGLSHAKHRSRLSAWEKAAGKTHHPSTPMPKAKANGKLETPTAAVEVAAAYHVAKPGRRKSISALIDVDLHRKLTLIAQVLGGGLDRLVERALQTHLEALPTEAKAALHALETLIQAAKGSN